MLCLSSFGRYRPTYQDNTGESKYPMFSLAVSIPYDDKKKEYDISQVTNSMFDSPATVKNSILKCKVYRGTRVVAATVLKWPNVLDQCPDEEVQWSIVRGNCNKKPKTWADLKTECPNVVYRADHAEYRVLENFDTLKNQNKNDFLLFYVLASPCGDKCTAINTAGSILKSIKQIMKWKSYALVFSDVFQPLGDIVVTEEDRKGALQRLGTSIGLKNIYRVTDSRCSRCSMSDNDDVIRFCYTDEPQPGPSHNKPSASNIQPPRGRSDSPSRSGQGEKDQNNKINKNAGVSTNVGRNSGGVVGQGDSGGGEGGWMTPKKRKGK
ncbi:uncharacterized protein LOC116380525 [Anarrhichthys ocellatus]|uniref:uncharacterized protein LOC116380525 n=1 Tax=Anarrhichthys ocellatus TaxID=433405 RepID=UPI0012ED1F2C|nr:uncharacterized protein LOC116380525 [Anarrhichthys ocellatus]